MLLTSGPFLKLSHLWLCLFSSFQKRPQRTPIIGAFPDSLLFAGSGSRTFFPHPRRAPTFEDPSSFLLLLHCVLKNSQPDSTCLFCSCIRTAEHGLAWTAALWTGARKVRCSWSYKSWLILGCLPLTFCWVAIFVQLFTCFLPTSPQPRTVLLHFRRRLVFNFSEKERVIAADVHSWTFPILLQRQVEDGSGLGVRGQPNHTEPSRSKKWLFSESDRQAFEGLGPKNGRICLVVYKDQSGCGVENRLWERGWERADRLIVKVRDDGNGVRIG